VGVAKWDAAFEAALRAISQRQRSFVRSLTCFVRAAIPRSMVRIKRPRQIAARMQFDVAPARGTTIAMPHAVSIRDLLMSAAAIAMVVALIALSDDRVRERMGDVNARSLSRGVVDRTTRVESATVSAGELALENGPLTILVIAGGVLVVCMLRT
jgi:hypothetical protein